MPEGQMPPASSGSGAAGAPQDPSSQIPDLLSQLAQALAASKAPKNVMMALQGLSDALSNPSDDDGDEQGEPAPGPSTPEQGGSAGAVPLSMRGG